MEATPGKRPRTSLRPTRFRRQPQRRWFHSLGQQLPQALPAAAGRLIRQRRHQGGIDRLQGRQHEGAAGQALGVGGGLGLAIVARYAELLQGRIELSGADDATGLRVSLTLAGVPAPTPQTERETGQSAPMPSTTSSNASRAGPR